MISSRDGLRGNYASGHVFDGSENRMHKCVTGNVYTKLITVNTCNKVKSTFCFSNSKLQSLLRATQLHSAGVCVCVCVCGAINECRKKVTIQFYQKQ